MNAKSAAKLADCVHEDPACEMAVLIGKGDDLSIFALNTGKELPTGSTKCTNALGNVL